MQNGTEFNQKLKLELPYDLAISHIGIFKGNEISVLKRYLYSYVHSMVSHNSQDIETT